MPGLFVLRLTENKAFDDVSHAILFIAVGNEIGTGLDLRRGIAHGNPQSGIINHVQIVTGIAHTDDLLA